MGLLAKHPMESFMREKEGFMRESQVSWFRLNHTQDWRDREPTGIWDINAPNSPDGDSHRAVHRGVSEHSMINVGKKR